MRSLVSIVCNSVFSAWACVGGSTTVLGSRLTKIGVERLTLLQGASEVSIGVSLLQMLILISACTVHHLTFLRDGTLMLVLDIETLLKDTWILLSGSECSGLIDAIHGLRVGVVSTCDICALDVAVAWLATSRYSDIALALEGVQ